MLDINLLVQLPEWLDQFLRELYPISREQEKTIALTLMIIGFIGLLVYFLFGIAKGLEWLTKQKI